MNIRSFINSLGIQDEFWVGFIDSVAKFVITAVIAWSIYIFMAKVVSPVYAKIAKRTSFKWDDVLLDAKFFKNLGTLFASVTLYLGFNSIVWKQTELVQEFISIWIVFAGLQVVISLLHGVNRIYDSLSTTKDKPIKVFIQVIVIFLYCAAILVVISIFTGKDALVLLGGLTVFASIIMLIFKDSILGLVAGIQLSANNMVRVGDWIEMPSSGADGDVQEINLTTVKVQNWDKTITTIPTYKMVSESFTNWKGMEESGGRRIKRSVNIDIDSIHYLSDEELAVLKDSELLKGYIESKMKELSEFNSQIKNTLDERRLTNIGTFREYMEEWLSRNPDINQSMARMVRQLQSGPTGIPLEIYCFSVRKKWVEYERVQADVFDHVFAVMELFNLKAFQYNGSIPPKGH